MLISAADNVVIEITRRCNMCCAHCLRGDAENIDIQEKYIDAFLDNFQSDAYIGTITFTGGEISLNIPAIRYTLKAVEKRGISVGSFYMVTNGKDASKMPELALASLEWWAYCEEKDANICGLCISSDVFHEDIPRESSEILSGLAYNRNDKTIDFYNQMLIDEGRAKSLDSSRFKKRSLFTEKLYVDYEDDSSVHLSDSELYLNAVGDIVVGCDWSYESQTKHRIGNVMDSKNWLIGITKRAA